MCLVLLKLRERLLAYHISSRKRCNVAYRVVYAACAEFVGINELLVTCSLGIPNCFLHMMGGEKKAG